MANHAYAEFRGIDRDCWDAFSADLEQAAIHRFGDACEVFRTDREVAVTIHDRERGHCVADMAFWRRDIITVEWRHQPERIAWWLAESLACTAARATAAKLGAEAVILDDGIEDEMPPDFDLRYPRYSDYEKSMVPGLLGMTARAMLRLSGPLWSHSFNELIETPRPALEPVLTAPADATPGQGPAGGSRAAP